MGPGRVKRVFPGGNTGRGFYSFYHYIIRPDAKRIFVIKGGPGVGKSTFMKRLGEAMLERGYDVEFHHCSSDNSSLDGVVFPTISVALIDGTAPHVVDPRNPGAVDEIIHLGDFWNEAGMRKHRREIIRLNREVSQLFDRAYRLLRAASVVYAGLEEANCEAMNFGRANVMASELVEAVLGHRKASERPGYGRHLFASAITPDGMVNYLDTILAPMEQKYVIEGGPGTGKSTLLRKVGNAATEAGLDVEFYHCALNPDKVEHVVIPEIGVALTKSIEPHTYRSAPEDVVIDMDRCLDRGVVARNREVMREHEVVFWDLFNRAVRYISLAKRAHDEMETYYIPNMDFEAVDRLWQSTLRRILDYAEEVQLAGR